MHLDKEEFDEVGAHRLKKEHDSGGHEVYGPQMMMGKVPEWLLNKRNKCPHCINEYKRPDDDGPTGALVRV